MVIDDDANSLAVDTPNFLVLMHVTIQPEHVEEHVDGQDCLATHVEEGGLHRLLLQLVALEEPRLDIDEITRFFKLALLSQDL